MTNFSLSSLSPFFFSLSLHRGGGLDQNGEVHLVRPPPLLFFFFFLSMLLMVVTRAPSSWISPSSFFFLLPSFRFWTKKGACVAGS